MSESLDEQSDPSYNPSSHEVGEPLRYDPDGYIRWYRSLGQDSDITDAADMLFEFSVEIVQKVYSEESEIPYLSRKEDQPYLLDAANMLAEAVDSGSTEADNAYQGAVAILDSILKGPAEAQTGEKIEHGEKRKGYIPDVIIDAAMYRGDLEFARLHAQGEFTEVEWEEAHAKALGVLNEAIRLCSESSNVPSNHRLPVGKIFEAFSINAARHDLLIHENDERNIFNTHYRAAYLREDRGHTGNHGERRSHNIDAAKLERAEGNDGWNRTTKWQLKANKKEEYAQYLDEGEHYAEDIIPVSYTPEEGLTPFVDNMLEYLKAFNKKARYISLLNRMDEADINPHLVPTNAEEARSAAGVARVHTILNPED